MTSPIGLSLGWAAMVLAALAVSPAGAATRAPDGHSSRSSVDWPGAYRGVLPSASGTGYQTVLVLREKGSRYTLIESIEHKGRLQHFRSEGQFRWNAAGSAITLSPADDRRRFVVGENQLESAGATLTKLESHGRTPREELLIDRASVKVQGQHVGFDGIWNMDHATQLGHRSLKARFDVDCKARSYRMRDLSYHARTWVQGKRLDAVADNGHDIPITPQDLTMRSVMKAHCPPG